jgi:hypothetical protein
VQTLSGGVGLEEGLLVALNAGRRERALMIRERVQPYH